MQGIVDLIPAFNLLHLMYLICVLQIWSRFIMKPMDLLRSLIFTALLLILWGKKILICENNNAEINENKINETNETCGSLC